MPEYLKRQEVVSSFDLNRDTFLKDLATLTLVALPLIILMWSV